MAKFYQTLCTIYRITLTEHLIGGKVNVICWLLILEPALDIIIISSTFHKCTFLPFFHFHLIYIILCIKANCS